MTATDGLNDAERYARLIAREVAGLERGVLDGYVQDEIDPDLVGTWLNTCALDVEVARSLTTGEVTAVSVTRTIGGPGCWITFRPWGDVEVVAAWGGDRATRFVRAEGVTDQLIDYAEAMSEAVRPAR